MQFPTQEQWWSYKSIHLLQKRQWWALGGFHESHFIHQFVAQLSLPNTPESSTELFRTLLGLFACTNTLRVNDRESIMEKKSKINQRIPTASSQVSFALINRFMACRTIPFQLASVTKPNYVVRKSHLTIQLCIIHAATKTGFICELSGRPHAGDTCLSEKSKKELSPSYNFILRICFTFG